MCRDNTAAGNIKAQWVSLWTGPVGVVLLLAALVFRDSGRRCPHHVGRSGGVLLRGPHAWIRFSQATTCAGSLILPLWHGDRRADEVHERTRAVMFAYCYLTAVVPVGHHLRAVNVFFLVAAFETDHPA